MRELNKEQIKAAVRFLLKEVYWKIEEAIDDGKVCNPDYEWILLMISAQALRLKEEKAAVLKDEGEKP